MNDLFVLETLLRRMRRYGFRLVCFSDKASLPGLVGTMVDACLLSTDEAKLLTRIIGDNAADLRQEGEGFRQVIANAARGI